MRYGFYSVHYGYGCAASKLLAEKRGASKSNAEKMQKIFLRQVVNIFGFYGYFCRKTEKMRSKRLYIIYIYIISLWLYAFCLIFLYYSCLFFFSIFLLSLFFSSSSLKKENNNIGLMHSMNNNYLLKTYFEIKSWQSLWYRITIKNEKNGLFQKIEQKKWAFFYF